MDFEAEQLVYGSFPFRGGGYDLLARSAGCSPALTAEVVAVCRRFGQPPSAEAARAGLCAVRLPSGPWVVVGVVPQGLDDRGRPGALAFHALIIARRDYARSGANPFAFASSLRADWSSATPATLARIRCSAPLASTADPSVADLKVQRMVQALAKRRRVAVEAVEPIDDLARAVWACLPARVRRRASVATWAFSGENRFDLVAFPRLAGVALDETYINPASLDAPPGLPDPAPRRVRDIRDPGSVAVAWVGLIVVGLAALAWSITSGEWTRQPPVVPAPLAAPTAAPDPSPISPAEAARLQAGLRALAERFEAFGVGPASNPTELLSHLADALHYHGLILTPAERDQIARDPDPAKGRVLAWHDQIGRFRDDQPWPGDFTGLPLPDQLAAVARSFHLDPQLPPAAVPDALIATLARPGLIQPTPLAARFPALSEYARFLGKLPRADDRPASQTGQ